MTKNQYFRLFEWASVFLFFIQALRVIFSVLFGIIYDGVFEGPFTSWLVVSVILVLLAFLSPMLIANRLRPDHLTILAILTALSRVMLSINVADVRYWGALATLIFGGFYLAAALRYLRPYATQGILLALCFDQFFRLLRKNRPGHPLCTGSGFCWPFSSGRFGRWSPGHPRR